MHTAKRIALFGLLASLCLRPPVLAGVKLITLPPRERVEIQLDHPQHTLVEEERLVPLTAGVNEVVFAWANANVRKETIQFRCLTDPDEIQVLSVSYPPDQHALTWQVSSPRAVSARVRISYLINGLDKSLFYRAVASNDESTLTLRQYVQLHNQSNEEFGMAGMWAGFGERFERPIGMNETKRLLANKFTSVPIEKTYTADVAAQGYLDESKNQLRIPMHYVIYNDKERGLGKFPLQRGKVRIFQDDGKGTTAFLGEDWGAFTPRDDKMKLALGEAKDIVVKRTIERREKVRVFGNLYNYDVIVKYEIENFKDRAVTLDLAENLTNLRNDLIGRMGRDVEWAFGDEGTLTEDMLDKEESTATRVLFKVLLPKRGADQKAEKQIHKLHVIIKNEW